MMQVKPGRPAGKGPGIAKLAVAGVLLSLPVAAWFVGATVHEAVREIPTPAAAPGAAEIGATSVAMTARRSQEPDAAVVPVTERRGADPVTDAADPQQIADDRPRGTAGETVSDTTDTYTLDAETPPDDQAEFLPEPFADSGHLYITNVGNEIIINRAPASATGHAIAARDSNDTADGTVAAATDPGADPALPTADTQVWITPDCPNQLPAGSSPADVDLMLQAYGCRYLSSCYAIPVPGDDYCSYYFRGFANS